MVRLSDIDLPVVFKDKLLFSSGIHNNLSILQEEIEKSLNLTNWEDQRTRSLFFAHSARDAQKWVGRVNNPHIINGQLFGDLEIHDADLALKLTYGKAPIGVSAEIRWPPQYNDPIDFTYRGFAMVPNPELPDTMINFSEQKKDDFKTAVVYVGEGDAKAEFSDTVKQEVVEEKKESQVVTSETARGSSFSEEEVKIEVKEEINGDEVIEEQTEEEKESNLMSAERGLNDKKMEENAKNVVQEEVVEEVKTEETKVDEVETKEEEVVEESKEDAKADFAKLNDKIEALEARVITLESGKADFSEEVETEEVEAKEEEKVEEEVKEEEVEEVVEESKDESETEDAKAEFSELADGIKKLTEVLMKKEAAPMSTAEFASGKIDKGNAVIDRLTEALSK